QAEQAFLEDGVAAVPQRQGQAQATLPVRESGDAVLAPAVGATAGLVVGEVLPGVAVAAVVLADASPLPFADVGSPLAPRLLPEVADAAVVFESLLFGVHGSCHPRSRTRGGEGGGG